MNATAGDDGPHTVVVDERPDGAEPPVDLDRIGRLVDDAVRAAGVNGPAELTVTFVDVDTITELNAEHMGVDGPTDVLSFPIDGAPDSVGIPGIPRILGDVVICPGIAAANAPQHAGTYEDELALLCVHGLLHVLGHDHAEPDEARVMRAEEARILALVHRPVAAGTEIPG